MTRLFALTAVAVAVLSCGASDTRQPLGASCTLNGQCHTGLICIADDPGGQCTKFCQSDADCGSRNLCDPEGKCYQACHHDQDCPRAAIDPRYGCVGDEPRRFCDAVDSSDGGAID